MLERGAAEWLQAEPPPSPWCQAPASCTRNQAGAGWGFPSQEALQASTTPRRGHRTSAPHHCQPPCLLVVLPARPSGSHGPPASVPFPPSLGGSWGAERRKSGGMGAGTHGMCPVLCSSRGGAWGLAGPLGSIFYGKKSTFE